MVASVFAAVSRTPLPDPPEATASNAEVARRRVVGPGVGVAARCLQARVAERLLDEVGRGPPVERVGRVGVPEEVGRDGVGEPGPPGQPLHDAPQLLPGERTGRPVGVRLPRAEHRPACLGMAVASFALAVGVKDGPGVGREEDAARLAALPEEGDLAGGAPPFERALDAVPPPEPGDLRHAPAGGVEEPEGERVAALNERAAWAASGPRGGRIGDSKHSVDGGLG